MMFIKNINSGQVWWYTPVNPAAQKAEGGEDSGSKPLAGTALGHLFSKAICVW
jgi:hypothetical protein